MTTEVEIPVLQPVMHQPLAKRFSDVALIPELAINLASYRLVGQDRQCDFDVDDNAQTVACDSLSDCSGLVMRDTAGADTVAHIVPFSDRVYEHLEKTKSQTTRQAVLLYGDESRPEFDLERLMLKGYFGSIILRKILVPSHTQHWAMVFDRTAGTVTTLTQYPQPQAQVYRIFPSELPSISKAN